jgi:REP element-mobilizing transposase RayT
MKQKQYDLFSNRTTGHRAFVSSRVSHGGAPAKGRRKIARPLDRRKPLHVVLKSSVAKGRLSLLSSRHRLVVEKTLRERAVQFGVKIHSFQNMGNHLHVLISFTNRELVQNFLRTVTALIARAVTGAKKGKPFGKRFWDGLAFTRVISGFKDFQSTEAYLHKNEVERVVGKEGRAALEDFEERRRSLRRKIRRKFQCQVL